MLRIPKQKSFTTPKSDKVLHGMAGSTPPLNAGSTPCGGEAATRPPALDQQAEKEPKVGSDLPQSAASQELPGSNGTLWVLPPLTISIATLPDPGHYKSSSQSKEPPKSPVKSAVVKFEKVRFARK